MRMNDREIQSDADKLAEALANARPDCPECHGDGWSRGWGPGPCRACALAEDRKRVPY